MIFFGGVLTVKCMGIYFKNDGWLIVIIQVYTIQYIGIIIHKLGLPFLTQPGFHGMPGAGDAYHGHVRNLQGHIGSLFGSDHHFQMLFKCGFVWK